MVYMFILYRYQGTESADGQWRPDQVITRGPAARLSVMELPRSSSSRDSRRRRRSQSAVVGSCSPAMRTDAGHTPLKIRRRCCGKKYSERLINWVCYCAQLLQQLPLIVIVETRSVRLDASNWKSSDISQVKWSRYRFKKGFCCYYSVWAVNTRPVCSYRLQ